MQRDDTCTVACVLPTRLVKTAHLAFYVAVSGSLKGKYNIV